MPPSVSQPHRWQRRRDIYNSLSLKKTHLKMWHLLTLSLLSRSIGMISSHPGGGNLTPVRRKSVNTNVLRVFIWKFSGLWVKKQHRVLQTVWKFHACQNTRSCLDRRTHGSHVWWVVAIFSYWCLSLLDWTEALCWHPRQCNNKRRPLWMFQLLYLWGPAVALGTSCNDGWAD